LCVADVFSAKVLMTMPNGERICEGIAIVMLRAYA
jgi:hypothetical protein